MSMDNLKEQLRAVMARIDDLDTAMQNMDDEKDNVLIAVEELEDMLDTHTMLDKDKVAELLTAKITNSVRSIVRDSLDDILDA